MAFGALGVLATLPGQTTGVSVFTDHLLQALGLTRVRLSTAYMAGTLMSAFFMTRAGRLYDRIGVRPAGAGAALGLALCLLIFSRMDSVVSFLTALFGGGTLVSAVVAFICASLGFLGIRFFGQGALTLVSRTMVMRWFESRRGRVAAVMGIATAAGFSYAPRMLQTLINTAGWRGAWTVLALILMSVVLPMILVFFRDSPEACGMTMEQGLRESAKGKASRNILAEDSTLAQARKDPRYWAYALLLAWWALFNTAFTFHVVDLFASRGVDAETAVSIFLPITMVSVTCNILGSWLSDSMDLPPFYFLAVLGLGAAGLALFNPAAVWSKPVLIAGLGVSSGLWSVLNNISWPRLFGRKHLGEISGSAMSLLVAGSALGPVIFSVLKTEAGYNYAGLFGILGPVCLLVLGIRAFVRKSS